MIIVILALQETLKQARTVLDKFITVNKISFLFHVAWEGDLLGSGGYTNTILLLVHIIERRMFLSSSS